jgi:hypothetical protein
VDIVTQNQQTVQCDVLSDSGQTVEESSGHSEQNQEAVLNHTTANQNDILSGQTNSGQTLNTVV